MGSLEKLEKYIAQANPLIEARKHMNVTEMRLFGLGLSDIKPHITDDKIYDVEFHDTWITYKELEDLFNISEKDNKKKKKISGGNITNLKRQIKKAFQSYIEIPNDKGGFRLNHIYEEMEYFPQEGLLIRFHDKLKPYILDLVGKAYTSYKLKLLFLLSSEYSQRIMELLLKQQGFFKKGHKKIYYEVTVEELRREFDIPDNLYVGRMDNFKSRVLDLPIKEINEKTDYEVSYEDIKRGRKITGFRLWLEMKEQGRKALPAPPAPEQEPIEKQLERDGQTKLFDSPTANEPPAPAVPGLTEGQQDLIDRMINRDVSAETAKMLVKKYPLEVISSNLKYAVQQKDTARNLAGLIIKFVENDMAGNQEKAKREAKERQKKKDKEKRMAYGIIEEKIEEKIEEEKIDLENISDDFKKFLNVKRGGK